MSQEMIPFHVTCPHSIREGGLTKFIRSPLCKRLCIQEAFSRLVSGQEQTKSVGA
jgi:hypothetical protein